MNLLRNSDTQIARLNLQIWWYNSRFCSSNCEMQIWMMTKWDTKWAVMINIDVAMEKNQKFQLTWLMLLRNKKANNRQFDIIQRVL